MGNWPGGHITGQGCLLRACAPGAGVSTPLCGHQCFPLSLGGDQTSVSRAGSPEPLKMAPNPKPRGGSVEHKPGRNALHLRLVPTPYPELYFSKPEPGDLGTIAAVIIVHASPACPLSCRSCTLYILICLSLTPILWECYSSRRPKVEQRCREK